VKQKESKMREIITYATKFGIIVVAGLLIGAGAVFALNPNSGPVADSVVVLKSMGVTCGSCAGRIEKALKEKPGVASVEVDVDSGGVAVAYDAKIAKPEILAETVTALGYESSILQNFSAEQYRTVTGRNVASVSPAKSGGCGGGCCNKNRN
jgi:copper chaperone CopZ